MKEIWSYIIIVVGGLIGILLMNIFVFPHLDSYFYDKINCEDGTYKIRNKIIYPSELICDRLCKEIGGVDCDYVYKNDNGKSSCLITKNQSKIVISEGGCYNEDYSQEINKIVKKN